MAITRETSRSRSWKAWAGTADQLRRILKIIEGFCGEKSLSVLLSVREAAELVSGNVDEVFSETDWRSVGKDIDAIDAKATGGAGNSSISLRLSPFDEGYRPSVQLLVESDDVRWAKQAFAQISEEVEKDVPFWAVLKPVTNVAHLILVLIMMLGVFFIVILSIILGPDSPFAEWSLPIVALPFVALAVLLGLALLLPSLSNRAFPRVQMLAEGQVSRGTRVLIGIGSLATTNIVAILIGIYVNKVS